MKDPYELIRRANPIPNHDGMPDGPESPAARALLKEIIDMNVVRSQHRKASKRIVLLAATMLLLGAAGAVAGVFGEGNLDTPPFSGDSWQFIVGEGANDEAGTSYKVCHRFAPVQDPSDGNGFGPSGCINWPLESPSDSIVLSAAPVDTPDGRLLFLDLSAESFDTVSISIQGEDTIAVEPFRMPASGKQFAVAELPSGARSATVRLLSSDGKVIEQHTVNLDSDS